MACRVQDKTINDVLELLIAEGFEGMADAMSTMLNEAMRLDRSRHLGAGPWVPSSKIVSGPFSTKFLRFLT